MFAYGASACYLIDQSDYCIMKWIVYYNVSISIVKILKAYFSYKKSNYHTVQVCTKLFKYRYLASYIHGNTCMSIYINVKNGNVFCSCVNWELMYFVEAMGNYVVIHASIMCLFSCRNIIACSVYVSTPCMLWNLTEHSGFVM